MKNTQGLRVGLTKFCSENPNSAKARLLLDKYLPTQDDIEDFEIVEELDTNNISF